MNLLSSTCQSVHPSVPPATLMRALQRPPAQNVTLATLLTVTCVLVRIISSCMCHGHDDDARYIELCVDGYLLLITLICIKISMTLIRNLLNSLIDVSVKQI